LLVSGILGVDGGEQPVKLRPWHGIVAALWVVACVALLYRNYQVDQGRKTFESLSCPSCHMAGGGPSLEHAGSKYDRATLVEFITNPDAVYRRMGRKPLNAGYPPMPTPKATPRQVELISHFLAAQR